MDVFIVGILLGVFFAGVLLKPNTSKRSNGGGCVNVPVANFNPPKKPVARPPSQYKKIELSKENICEINKCKCCSKANSCKVK